MQSHRLPGVNNRTGFVDPRKPSYSAGFEQGHKDTGEEHRCKSGLSQKSGYISTKAYGLGDTVTLEKAQENHEAVTAGSERQNSDSQGTQIQQRNGISSGKAKGKHRIRGRPQAKPRMWRRGGTDMYIFKSGKKKVHNCELININMLIKKNVTLGKTFGAHMY